MRRSNVLFLALVALFCLLSASSVSGFRLRHNLHDALRNDIAREEKNEARDYVVDRITSAMAHFAREESSDLHVAVPIPAIARSDSLHVSRGEVEERDRSRHGYHGQGRPHFGLGRPHHGGASSHRQSVFLLIAHDADLGLGIMHRVPGIEGKAFTALREGCSDMIVAFGRHNRHEATVHSCMRSLPLDDGSTEYTVQLGVIKVGDFEVDPVTVIEQVVLLRADMSLVAPSKPTLLKQFMDSPSILPIPDSNEEDAFTTLPMPDEIIAGMPDATDSAKKGECPMALFMRQASEWFLELPTYARVMVSFALGCAAYLVCVVLFKLLLALVRGLMRCFSGSSCKNDTYAANVVGNANAYVAVPADEKEADKVDAAAAAAV